MQKISCSRRLVCSKTHMRIDKYLANLWLVPRRKSREVFKAWAITINQQTIKDPDYIIHEGDIIFYNEISITYKPIITILLHKPAGYVCSDIPEGKYPSYRDLLEDCVYKEILHVAGRLDADTTGLVLLTNDGDLNHRIISPKKKLVKIYEVDLEKPINQKNITNLEEGVILEDGYKTLPAQVEKISDNHIRLSIHEGKYHQVKRMLEAVNNKVTKLHRTQIGECKLWNLSESKRIIIDEKYIFSP